jgi:hypothetical protein
VDLFCSGHTYLPDGDLLVAGGTKKYEVLADKVTKAAGVLILENKARTPVTITKGTRLAGPNGKFYVATEEITVPGGSDQTMPGMLMPGRGEVWVEAEEEGKDYVTKGRDRFTFIRPDSIAKHLGAPVARKSRLEDLTIISEAMTLQKQNYRGLKASYIYSVQQQKYIKTTNQMSFGRWYPTLVSINGGSILAVSGLNEHGNILYGDNEQFELSNKSWRVRSDLHRYFPTYPHLFRLKDGRLFYSGANTGYGSATQGRQPGIWDLTDNSFQKVRGLRVPGMNETASSFMLPPVQQQKVAFVGGGAVGDSNDATNRFDVVDLKAENPVYKPMGQDYASQVRYLNAVTLPDDTVLLTNGSTKYRGRGLSDLHLSRIYHPVTGRLSVAASNEVGRDYHGTALLLPDGRVMTEGSDPLFSDKAGTRPGSFETRIEIYTPPYLETGTPRPQIVHAPKVLQRNTSFTVHANTSNGIATARLLRPSAVTHQTDPEQRSIALDVTLPKDCLPDPGQEEHCDMTLTLGKLEGITPSGYYMLMLVDNRGVPSRAAWVRVM